VLPEVAHVVFVDEALTRPQLEVGQGNLVGIVVKEHTAIARDPIRLAVDPKLM
jgi:hypothetical protein